MTLVDSHAHLDSADFSVDLPEVLARASGAGVTEILTVGCLGADSGHQGTLRLIEDHANLWAALGVHPHDARFYDATLEATLLGLMKHPRVLAWGEIGLDYHYNYSPREQQREVFRRQLRLAVELGKPVVIHTREAEEDTLSILEEETRGEKPGVLHCFTSSRDMAERCLALGFCVSFGGILSFPKAEELRRIARDVPGDRLLIETDCPYLAPVPHRGRRNEPAFVARVAEALAEIRGVSPSMLAHETADNFARLFKG